MPGGFPGLILEQPVMGFQVDFVHSIDDFFNIITGKGINISKPKVLLVHNCSISFQVFFYPFEFFSAQLPPNP